MTEVTLSSVGSFRGLREPRGKSPAMSQAETSFTNKKRRQVGIKFDSFFIVACVWKNTRLNLSAFSSQGGNNIGYLDYISVSAML
jgi:hypothetical protein